MVLVQFQSRVLNTNENVEIVKLAINFMVIHHNPIKAM